MSTRSATIIRQTTYWGEESETEGLMRFYRHCDGYPEGHGMDLANAVEAADKKGCDAGCWLANVLEWFFLQSPHTSTMEFESSDSEHDDLEFLYVLEGIVDRRWGRKPDKTLPVTISVYGIEWDESYEKAMGRDPIFNGTAYEYIEKFGKEQ